LLRVNSNGDILSSVITGELLNRARIFDLNILNNNLIVQIKNFKNRPTLIQLDPSFTYLNSWQFDLTYAGQFNSVCIDNGFIVATGNQFFIDNNSDSYLLTKFDPDDALWDCNLAPHDIEVSNVSLITGSSTDFTSYNLSIPEIFVDPESGPNDPSAENLCPNPPEADFIYDTMICVGQCIDFIDNSINGPTNWEWTFNGAVPISSLEQNPENICYPDTGIFSITLLVSNPSGQDQITKDIWVKDQPEVDLGNDTTMCDGDTLYLRLSLEPDEQCTWQDGSTGDEFMVLVPGEYIATISNPYCEGSDTINVDYFGFSVNLGNDTVLCNEETLSLFVPTSGGEWLEWQDGSSSNTYTVTDPGEYYVTKYSNNCQASDSIEVDYSEISISLGNDTTLCENEALRLMVTTDPGENLLWQDGSTANEYVVTIPGIYSVIKSNQYCAVSDSIQVLYSEINIELGPDTMLCDDETYTLHVEAAPDEVVVWQDGTTANEYIVYSPGEYVATKFDPYCHTSDTVYIDFRECLKCSFGIPNAFTPNQDGKNDEFGIITNCIISNFEMYIYNRWGALVFESSDHTKSWDGKIAGEYAPAEVYMYLIKFKYSDDYGEGDETRKGSVVILNTGY